MLVLEIKLPDMWDEVNSLFIDGENHKLVLEHNLIAISKWESITNRFFIDEKPKTQEDTILYIKCMDIHNDYIEDKEVYKYIDDSHIEKIDNYINNKYSATTINSQQSNNKNNKKSDEKLSSEYIYYILTAFNIPFEVEKWHLNRMMSLIKIAEIKNEEQNSKGKKKTPKRTAAERAAANKAKRGT